ncbi:MAG: hypothetical protein WCE21_01430 [Candidatus Babeliales bacterium]
MNKLIASIFISGIIVLNSTQLMAEAADIVAMTDQVEAVVIDTPETEQQDAVPTGKMVKAYLKPAVIFAISAFIILMIAKMRPVTQPAAIEKSDVVVASDSVETVVSEVTTKDLVQEAETMTPNSLSTSIVRGLDSIFQKVTVRVKDIIPYQPSFDTIDERYFEANMQ